MTTSTHAATLASTIRRAAAALATIGLALALPALPQAGSFGTPLAPAAAHASAAEAPSHATLAHETALIDLVNADRASNGLPTLEFDPGLASVARWRSEDMAARQYFSHDIGGYQVFQVLRDVGITYRVAGENLAYNYYSPEETAPRAEKALMESPTHRANILRADYTHLGVGVAMAPDGRVLYTQLFKTAW